MKSFCLILDIVHLAGVTLPDYPPVLTVSSGGAAAEGQPAALGVFYRLPGLEPAWHNLGDENIQLVYDGKYL